MAKVRMLKTGLTIGRKVRRQGEIFELPDKLPVSLEGQAKHFKNKIPWWVEVGSDEEKLAIAMGGMVQERDAFSSDKTISPGFAPAHEKRENMVTEQVPKQPTDKEIEATMVGDTSTSVIDEEDEEDPEEDEDNLSTLTRKELREVIEEEELEVQYNKSTNRNDLIASITVAREEE